MGVRMPISSLQIRPPPNRNPKQCGWQWLQDKQQTDGAEGLWRIHNKLYDLSSWIDRHPGGKDWIKLTKGTDITEAFEVHHLTAAPMEMLSQYYIRPASQERNSPFTFHENGFYKTLKKRVVEILPQLPKQRIKKSDFITDALLIAVILLAIVANVYSDYKLAILSGLLLTYLTIASHNYFHRKDNIRMYYFNLSMMSHREWRISHALSHHLHTNTIDDMEIIFPESTLKFLPMPKSSIYIRTVCFVMPFYAFLLFHMSLVKTYTYGLKGITDILPHHFLPFLLPLAMHLASSQALGHTLMIWTIIVAVGSAHFAWIGFTAAHHHPDIFHDGDKPRSTTDYDWGLSQLDAIIDRKESIGNHFLTLTTFGDHTLHHLFPTLDHGALDSLYPILQDVCDQFGVNVRRASQWEMLKGTFRQLKRTSPNQHLPDLLKIY